MFPELRTAHLEEIDAQVPRQTYYFKRNYDLRDAALPPHVTQVRPMRAARVLFSSRGRTLELFEPLWVEYLPHWVLLACAWRLRNWRDRSVVCFAIENNDPVTVLSRGRAELRPIAYVALPLLRVLLRATLSRCCFGTEAARESYRGLLSRHTDTRVTLDLLRARSDAPEDKKPRTAAFVGALEERKGVFQLMAAWEVVEQRVPGVRLTLVGDGPLMSVVREWANHRPTDRVVMGRTPRAEIRKLLDSSVVLVAPSIPVGRWREQVGRPIQEGLASGCTVVTTDQTGIADTLVQLGHQVVPVECLSEQLVDACIHALLHPLAVGSVLDSLPQEDGRIQADRWLHEEPGISVAGARRAS